MAYSQNPKDYTFDEMRLVAHLHYVEEKTFQAIEKEYGIARTKAAAMCAAARQDGIVSIVIQPAARLSLDRRITFGKRVREKFDLLDCIVVNGRPEMLDPSTLDFPYLNSPPLYTTQMSALHDVIINEIAAKAADTLVARFGQTDKPTLAVTFGRITRMVANAVSLIRPRINKQGMILTAQGIRSLEQDRFDGGDIARDLARDFGCHYAVMPIPMFAERDCAEKLAQSYVVKEILQRLANDTNIVLSSLGPLGQNYNSKIHSSFDTELTAQDEINHVKEAGAVGNLGGWWFDKNGEFIDFDKFKVLGLGLEKINLLVMARKPVMLVVGADPSRLPAVSAAISGKRRLGNVLVTDEYFARALLGEFELSDSLWSKYSENERAAVKQAIEFVLPGTS